MKHIASIGIALLTGGMALAQGTVEDYNRAYELREKYNSKHVFYSNVNPQWIDGTNLFWYVRNTPEGNEYVKVDAGKQKRTALFDQQKLSAALESSTGKDIDPMQLPIQRCHVTPGADTLRFVYEGKRWCFDIRRNRLTDEGQLPAPGRQRHWMEVDDEKGGAPVTSPDGKYVAFIKNDNICVREVATGKETQLSQDGTPGNYYSSYIQWSPDSKLVAAFRIRPAQKRYVYYVESSPADQLQPKLHKQEYAKPGDELAFKVPCIYGVENGKRLIPSTDLFSHQYEIYALQWNSDSKGITFEYNERGHKVYRVLEVSAEDGSVRPLIEEKEEKYVNYPRIFRHFLADGKRIIWSSERDNYNHLYMYDRATARPTHQITKGEWYVREVQYVDEENQQIYFSANGMNKDEDPYLIHYYRIGFDGKGLTALTPEEGMHKAWYSSDYKYLVDVYSKVDQAPVAVVRSAADGKIVMPLEKADIAQLTANGWKAPEVFTAKGRDGKTDMWGIIYRPSNFDPAKKYPVIEYIYSGPGDQYVPKTFSSYNWWMTSLAELGFIVVQVDGMTTSFRSKEFEEVCYKNLKDAGLPDHIAWIKAAAQKYPYMDIDRVGIFGCSAGGQESTTAVLLHPEFYKAAYSACGCHDNRMDKIWWNELWMGYPVDDSYKECSNVENAHLLQRPLMLVVGEMDDNVDPASTMQVVNALIKANKDFELVVIPGAHHTMGEDFGEHKRYDFFVRNLMGVNPPAWSEVNTGTR
ncbi:MAG TPA: S9 family peptidase [Candidatus Phocaeicola gallinarum]|uniref:S9 family peptidase n=1 Tax=Bacteroides caecicola TaxID=1462569 RepID=UPI001C5C3222|nr:S9 family peptidase [Bacteroides caecicola]MCL1624837.1 S9 family peptidase [Bacteroides caecicola]HJC95229.1 S9 family peptidase [Candidatus Phocaeicola gallinarum]